MYTKCLKFGVFTFYFNMELPHLGEHCAKSDCHKLDFLPVKCDACNGIFCNEHFSYISHNCSKAYEKNNQVPACPLCSKPIPVKKGEHPDYVVSAHIDTDCQSDPAKSRRKVFTNRCSYNKCKNKEVIPVICNECSKNYCVKHRHPTDHSCDGRKSRPQNLSDNIHGNLSEDEALARALALSMNNSVPTSKSKQEELDLALARQLQASETRTTTVPSARSSDRCIVS